MQAFQDYSSSPFHARPFIENNYSPLNLLADPLTRNGLGVGQLQNNIVETVVHPGKLDRISYSDDYSSLTPLDSKGNAIDITDNPAFKVVIYNDSNGDWPPQKLVDFSLSQNWSSKEVSICLADTSTSSMNGYVITDSTAKTIPYAYKKELSADPVVDLSRSHFRVHPQHITASGNTTVDITLVDLNGDRIETDRLSPEVLDNLSIFHVFPDNEEVQQLRVMSDLTIRVNITKSGFSYFHVTYQGVEIYSIYGQNENQWCYTAPDANSQYTVSMVAVQKNKLSSPEITSDDLKYLTFMKTQPFYILARICDSMGNVFDSIQFYSYYNVGDLAIKTFLQTKDFTISKMRTQISYNVIAVTFENDQRSRDQYWQLMPSYYPQNPMATENNSSYVINLQSPSIPGIGTLISITDVYLVVTSDSLIDNQFTNVDNGIGISGLQGPNSFIDSQITLRQFNKTTAVIQLSNDNKQPYLSERVTSLSISSNTEVDSSRVQMNVVPFTNDGFYLIYLYSEQLYDRYPLNLTASLKTVYTHSSSPLNLDLTMQVFPPTPPNYLNPIDNATWLAEGQTKYTRNQEIEFNLELKHNDTLYFDDTSSTSRIVVFKGGTQQQVQVELVNHTVYQFSVLLDGSQTSYFSIYYQDAQGVLFPITQPETIQFDSYMLQSQGNQRPLEGARISEGFKWWKFNQFQAIPPNENSSSITDLTSESLSDLEISFVANFDNGNYVIGKDLRISVLVLNKTNVQCLTASDYDAETDLLVSLQAQPTDSKPSSPIQIPLVKKAVSLSSPSCSYYALINLQQGSDLSDAGPYTFKAVYKSQLKASLTFNAVVKGIDYSQTEVTWLTQQVSKDNNQVAQIYAREPFNYVIYLKDIKGNSVTEKQNPVKIDLKFEGQDSPLDSTDFDFHSHFDPNIKGYLVVATFFKPGSYQPQYFFNGQKANSIRIQNGPLIFTVLEAQCREIQVDHKGQQTLAYGQVFSFTFSCLDTSGEYISENIDQGHFTAAFINKNTNNILTQSTAKPLSQGKFEVNKQFFVEGRLNMKLYYHSLLLYNDPDFVITVSKGVCTNAQTGRLMFKCPLSPEVCVNSYYECDSVNKELCTDSSKPFQCGKSNPKCVSNLFTDCCTDNEEEETELKWCPHRNECVDTAETPCCSLDPETPLYCKAKGTCVRYRHQCCEDYTFSEQSDEGTEVLSPLVKCKNEDKCAPKDSKEFCFSPFNRDCSEIYPNANKSFQCMSDGKCKRNSTECSSPRVCPPDYTQCPDHTCIPGVSTFNECPKLDLCEREIPDRTLVEYIRCPDGSCTKSYEECPSAVSCMVEGQVVCPDGSCKESEDQCIQPIECSAEKPIRCGGFTVACAKSIHECHGIIAKTCGPTQMLCPDGECSTSCYQATYLDQASKAIQVYRADCNEKGKVQCSNGECRDSYFLCSDSLYCPHLSNFTYNPQPFVCPYEQICAQDLSECSRTQCTSSLNSLYLSPIENFLDSEGERIFLDSEGERINKLTCQDGRCHLQNITKTNACMTPLSCSPSFIKTGGVGQLCLSSTALGSQVMELAIKLNSNRCQRGAYKCITGEFRSSFDDCPSQVTCPEELPILCIDGSCVKQKNQCNLADQAVESNLKVCHSLGFLLCLTDLVTCTDSLQKCPARSSCAIGFIKCWDESCIDPNTAKCPEVEDQLQPQISTCPSTDYQPYHCFADGSCKASLTDCPSLSYCPQKRPVKCVDGSCRSSITNCPIIECPTGFQICPGEGNCVENISNCGTVSTCPKQSPYKCEDGMCVARIDHCKSQSHQLTPGSQACLTNRRNILCSNNPEICTKDIKDCPKSSSCDSMTPVKQAGTARCYQSRAQFSVLTLKYTDNGECSFSNQYLCEDGKCHSELCPEWVTCQTSGSPTMLVQCDNGQCVSNRRSCPSSTNGCPFYNPQKCPQSGKCVQSLDDCSDNPQASN